MPTPTIPQVKPVKPKRHHGYSFFLFLLGTLFPPLAVAARFGIGGDFWLNLVLTLCGYIPGHCHNFYLQNIRNNKNHRRTPKWAQRHGLVDTSTIKRKERRSQWANRYEERLAKSTLENQAVEDGQIPDAASVNSSADASAPPRRDGELWNAQEEQYYGQSNGSTSERRSQRWHYPANFDDADTSSVLDSSTPKKKKKIKKDRFARTEDAYSITDDTTPRKKKKKRSKRTTVGDDDTYSARSGSTGQPEFPEDPEGGLYGDTRRGGAQSNGGAQANDETNFDHQF